MTIRELFREFVIAKQIREDAQRRDLALAWHIEAFARQEKLPPLMQLLQPGRPSPRQTAREHRAMLETLSQQYGIPLRRRTLSA